jgi:hypothetical protein
MGNVTQQGGWVSATSTADQAGPAGGSIAAPPGELRVHPPSVWVDGPARRRSSRVSQCGSILRGRLTTTSRIGELPVLSRRDKPAGSPGLVVKRALMLHFSIQLRCRHCDHTFVVCVHAEEPLDPEARYAAHCPVNNSQFILPSKHFRPVDHCPAGAVEGHLWRSEVPSSTGPQPQVKRRWWQFWLASDSVQ